MPRPVHVTLLVENARGWRNLCRLITEAHRGTREPASRDARARLPPSARSRSTSSSATPRGWSASPAARATAPWPGSWERGRPARRRRRWRGGCCGAFGPEPLPDRAAAAVLAARPGAQPLARLAGRAARRALRGDRQRPRPRPLARCRSRTRWWRCGWARPSTRPRRCGAATPPRPCSPPRAMAAAPLPRPPGGGRRDGAARRAAALRPHPRPRLQLSRARRTAAPTGGWPSSAGSRLGPSLRRGRRTAPRPSGGWTRSCALIRKLRLSGFFLLHHDMLELAREVAAEVRGPDSARRLLPPGRGRGSSVSSIVCYLTGLSHIDPVQNELFLGRFLNEELTEVPDIDLDFPRDIREKLIPRVHERYGRGALGAGRGLRHLPVARRDPRPRQGARAAARRGRAGRARRGRLRGEPRCAGRGWRRRSAGCGPRSPRWRALAELLPGDRGPAAPHLPAPRRHGDLDHAADRPLPGAAGGDGGAPDRPVGQGLLRGRRLPEDRPAGAGDALGGRALRGRDRAHARRADRPLARPARRRPRSGARSSGAETTGVFQIESRAQMQMLPRTLPREPRRPDRAGGAGAARADPGRRRPPLHRAAQAAAGGPLLRGPLRAPVAGAGAARTRSGRSSSRTRCSRWRWRSPASRVGEAEGLRRAMSRKRSEAAMLRYRERFIEGAIERGVEPRGRPSGSSGRSRASRASASPRRTRPRSACSPTSRPGCGCTTGRSSCARCSTSSRWASTRRTRWCTRRSGAGSRSCRRTSTSSELDCRVETTGAAAGSAGSPPVRIGLGYVAEVAEVDAQAVIDERRRGGAYRSISDLAGRSGAGAAALSGSPGPGACDAARSQRLEADAMPADPDEELRRPALWEVGRLGAGRAAPTTAPSSRCRSTAPPLPRCRSSARGSGSWPTTGRPG